tara:strand:+ start:307 stop:618 length:312 start_codon:yes stop_codon:yes gene_type:complete
MTCIAIAQEMSDNSTYTSYLKKIHALYTQSFVHKVSIFELSLGCKSRSPRILSALRDEARRSTIDGRGFAEALAAVGIGGLAPDRLAHAQDLPARDCATPAQL